MIFVGGIVMANLINEIILQIQAKYNTELAKKDLKDIENALELIENCRQKVAQGENIKLADEIPNAHNGAKEIFELLEKIKQEIKKSFIENKQNLTHITDKSPEEIIGGELKVSNSRANHYEVERGDFFFASSTPIDGNNLYLARNANDGMIVRGNVCIYGSEIFKIGYNENTNRRLLLKNSNYVYEINPEQFEPVVMLVKDKNSKPYFDFSEEWCSEKSVDINDKNQVKSVRKVDDVTEILSNYQIFTDVNKTQEGIKILNCNSKQEMWNKFLESLKSGKIRYINRVMNVNINEEIMAIIEPEIGEK